jgi:hypothetical protein
MGKLAAVDIASGTPALLQPLAISASPPGCTNFASAAGAQKIGTDIFWPSMVVLVLHSRTFFKIRGRNPMSAYALLLRFLVCKSVAALE